MLPLLAEVEENLLDGVAERKCGPGLKIMRENGPGVKVTRIWGENYTGPLLSLLIIKISILGPAESSLSTTHLFRATEKFLKLKKSFGVSND